MCPSLAPPLSPAAPRVGGYVIHGNNVATLGRCLDDLLRVCDTVVAVDSNSTDGSAELARARGVRSITQSWAGYGAARARAVQELGDVDYVFFLDSDEVLDAQAVRAFAAWRESGPTLPHYTVRRRDWAVTARGRFVFRTETRKRLVRRDAATWSADMIVHEALPSRPSAPLGTYIDHVFCQDPAVLADKLHVYALLWAVRFFEGQQRAPLLPSLRRWGYLLRNAFVKGAFWRGGLAGLRLCWLVANYHTLKYRYRRALRAGLCTDLVEAFREGEYASVYRAAPAAVTLMRAAL